VSAAQLAISRLAMPPAALAWISASRFASHGVSSDAGTGFELHLNRARRSAAGRHRGVLRWSSSAASGPGRPLPNANLRVARRVHGQPAQQGVRRRIPGAIRGVNAYDPPCAATPPEVNQPRQTVPDVPPKSGSSAVIIPTAHTRRPSEACWSRSNGLKLVALFDETGGPLGRQRQHGRPTARSPYTAST